jgi:hypothetical protein
MSEAPDRKSPLEPALRVFLFWLLPILSAVIYYLSGPDPKYPYDYTFRVAENFIHGRIGILEPPPEWLNEFVFVDGLYYSAFPLGSVLTMVPFAALKAVGFINQMPSAWIAALSAFTICILLNLIVRRYELSFQRTILMPLGILFGTWMWMNLSFAGAWQLALGFAMIGQLGAIYFSVYERRPFVAGLFFALAFGNRTEVILTAPIFLYLLTRKRDGKQSTSRDSRLDDLSKETDERPGFFGLPLIDDWRSIIAFCSVPFVLGCTTLLYNFVRFHSFADFGYARIPGVLNEPWYRYGIFSIWYIPDQIWQMLFKPWESYPYFPYFRPNRFSSSILLSSPFILYSLRFLACDRPLRNASWLAIAALCLMLWTHGNSGGWQFGYRYAMVCLPWLFVILLESSPRRITTLEWAAYLFSFMGNGYATWLFNWDDFPKQ